MKLLLALGALMTVTWSAVEEWPFVFVPPDLYKRLPQPLGDPVHPNVMAGALVILLPITAARLIFPVQDAPRYERRVAGLAALPMTAILVLTRSRNALLAAALALAALSVFRWRRACWAIPPATVAAGIAPGASVCRASARP